MCVCGGGGGEGAIGGFVVRSFKKGELSVRQEERIIMFA